MATYAVTIGGVSKTFKGGITITETANGRNKLSAAVYSAAGSYRPAVGDEVIVTEDGTRIFGGNIDTPGETGAGGLGITPIVTNISAVDFNALADRRFIAETIAAGTLKAALIRITTYLSSYGVTLDAAQVNGPTLAAIPFDYVTITTALNQLSALTDGAYIWEIDYTKTLRMVLASGTAAPFNIVDGDRHAIGDITVEPSSGFYANRVIVRFSAAARTAYAFLAATGTFANGEQVTVGGQTYTLQTVLVNTADNVLIGADQEATLNNLVAAITAGAGAGSVYGTGTAANASATAYMVSAHLMKALALTAGSGGNSTAVHETCANASWITEGGGTVSTFQLGADSAVTNTVQSDDLTEQGLLGLWEQIISEPTITDTTIAQALADSYLAKAIAKPKRVRYRTHQTGIHPGMTQTITIATRNLTGTYIVTDVTIRSLVGTYVVREVIAVGGSNLPARWQDDARRLFAGTGGGSSGGGASITVVTGGEVSGSGTTNTVPKWTSTTSAVLGDSSISDTGGVVTIAGTLSAATEISVTHATSPSLYLSETGAGSNLKNWRWNVASQVLSLQTVNDARSSVLLTAMSVVRTTGALTIANGLTAGSGAVGIINSTGKIPALTSTYFASLSFAATNLTGLVAAANGGTGLDSSVATGIPQLVTGAWNISLTLQNAIQDNITRLGTISTAATFSSTLAVTGVATFTTHILPSTVFTSDLGSLTTKMRAIYASELWVSTLVAQSTIATIGGRVLVAPTNELVANRTAQLAGPTPTVTPQGVTGATSYSYKVTALDVDGESMGSTAGTTTTGNATLNGSNFNRLTWTTVAGAVYYAIYGRISGSWLYINTVAAPTTTFDDTGTATIAVPPPSTNTTCRQFKLKYRVGLPNEQTYMESNGKVEFLQVTTWAIVAVNTGTKTFSVSGDRRDVFIAGRSLVIRGSTGNDGEYSTNGNSTYNSGTARTAIVVNETVPSSTADGGVALVDTGSGVILLMTRDRDGTGSNDWYAGDAMVNTGTTGNGFIDLYSTSGVLSGSGPTIVGNVRTGTAYNNIAPRWAIGNLNGVSDYVTSIYGVFAGDSSATNITIDATNGFRIRSGTTDKLKADTSGNLSLTGDLAMSTSGAFRAGATAFGTGTGWWLDYNAGTPRFRIGNPSGQYLQWDGTNFVFVGAAGNFTVDSSGVTISAATGGAYASDHAYRFSATTTTLGMGADASTSSVRSLYLLSSWTGAGNITAGVTMQASGGSGGGVAAATLTLTHTGTASSAIIDAQTLTLSGSAGNMAISLQGSLAISSSGLVMGSPTGGNKGAGTINIAGDIYKNNTAYTNPQWALKHAFTGAADVDGAYAAPSWYTGLRSIEDHRSFVSTRYDLPLMAQELDAGLMRRGDLLLASVEEAYLYIYQLHDRIEKLEARVA